MFNGDGGKVPKHDQWKILNLSMGPCQRMKLKKAFLEELSVTIMERNVSKLFVRNVTTVL